VARHFRNLEHQTLTGRHFTPRHCRFLRRHSYTALDLSKPALAEHGDKDKNEHGNKHDDRDEDQGWDRRDGYEYRAYSEGDERPPGWNRGKKTGWGDCGLPPGQAKHMDVGPRCTKAVRTTTTGMTSKFMGASSFTDLSGGT
jgi:hypothetical protein